MPWANLPHAKESSLRDVYLDVFDTLQELCPFTRGDLVAGICSLGIFKTNNLIMALGSLMRSLVAWLWHSVSFAKISLN